METNNNTIIQFFKFAIISACAMAITYSIVNNPLGG